jgi:hypothetical protein
METLQSSELTNGLKMVKRLGLRDFKFYYQNLTKTNLNYSELFITKNRFNNEKIGLVKPEGIQLSLFDLKDNQLLVPAGHQKLI